MSIHIEYNDLCVSCNYNSLCSGRKNLLRPVWYCEEFDDYSPKNLKSPTVHNYNSPIVSQNVEYDCDFKGLCINCENREHCLSARQEGGVWNCDEYL